MGTGTNGLVSSTLGIGSTITSFDPLITGTLQLDKDDTESTSALSPVPVLAQNTYTANLSPTRRAFSGEPLCPQVFNNTHVTTNNPTSLLTPDLSFELSVPNHAKPAARLWFADPTCASFASPRTTAKFPMSPSACKPSRPSIKSKTCIGTWSMPTKTCACSRKPSPMRRRPWMTTKQQAKVGTVPPIQVVSAQSTLSTDQQNLILAQNNLTAARIADEKCAQPQHRRSHAGRSSREFPLPPCSFPSRNRLPRRRI
jgi:hypothetical protein